MERVYKNQENEISMVEEHHNIQEIAKKEAKSLIQLYFRFYELNKKTAYTHFYYRFLEKENLINNCERMGDLVIKLVLQYHKKMKWNYSEERKLKLQDQILANIK